ncbi:MAG: GNAT family N-acetyltransferase [Oscillospiraceae bacterium]|nr:GNAT family N-acetyltransferase [Oscillospiraceae bacterium]
MNVTIVKLQPEDAYEYTACHIACWQMAYKDIIPDDYLKNMPKEIEQRTEKLRKRINELSDSPFHSVKLENKMIGILSFGKSRDEDKSDAGEVYAIYLLADFWDKGYGRQMMNYAVAALKNNGYHEIIVWVLEENNRARRFYEKCDFSFDGTKKELQIGKTLIEVRYVLEGE